MRTRGRREVHIIQTANLKLIPCELQHFEAILNDQKELEQILGVTVFDNWFDFPGVAGIEAMKYAYEYLQSHPDALGWWTYLFIYVKDNALIGPGGYQGKADESGMVEIGYSIIPAYQGRGLATEAAKALIDHAFSHVHIRMVDAHTLAEHNASTRVLEKVGMTHVGTSQDPDVGEAWHWRLSKENYRKA